MKVTQLSNGLTLIYEKSDNDLPITSIYAFCNLGPAHEPNDMKGISHFIEHMCFKGTRKNPTPKSIFSVCEKIGAYFNAYTSKRFTCYTIDCDSKYSQTCIYHLSDMLFHSIFDKNEFKKELNVVAQENRDDLNDPMEVAENQILKELFKNSSYQDPIDHVDYHKKQFDYNKCVELYKLFYTPNNMFLSIASNLSLSTILKHVRNSFFKNTSSSNNLSKLIKINHHIENSKKPTINLIKKEGVSNNTIIIGFRVCEFNHPDRYILDLIQTAVGENMTGKLKYTLREEKGLVYTATIDTQYFEKFGCLLFVSQTEYNNLILPNNSGVYPIIMKIIRDIKKNGLTQKEINDAKGSLKGKLSLNLQNNSNLAEENGENILLGEKAENLVPLKNKYNTFYKQIYKSQVHKVIKKYFELSNMSICIVGEKNPSFKEVQKYCQFL
mgnify:FL=1